jgi:membrane protein YdbS with pleckstrin-like domain
VTNRLELGETDWRRVSPKLIWVQLLGTLVVAVVLVGLTVPLYFAGFAGAPYLTAVVAVVVIIVLIVIPRRVRAFGYVLREDDLLFRRGIMFLRFVAVPYGRMQLIDINRGPVARILGLSELRFVTAAASTGVTIPGLPERDADELRDRLVALAESRRAGL